MNSLDRALEAFARQPSILVACDFDGTLAPIVDQPSAAAPLREAVVALRGLAELGDHTHVAVISGRALRDLATLSRLPDEVHLVGSHGSEFDVGFASAMSPEQLELRHRVEVQLRRASADLVGSMIETKPASVAFHYRLADPVDARRVVAELAEEFAAVDGVWPKRGYEVIEFSIVETDKGTALDRVRQQLHVEAVLFAGDDVTDEDGFARLSGPDVPVKVGDGPSLAAYRVRDPVAVAQMLARLLQLRSAWLHGDRAPAIERHSALSNRHQVALLTPDARITWMCAPRPDSPAVFAELIGGPSAGHFSIRPQPERRPLDQRYWRDSMVVETRWASARVIDFLDDVDEDGLELARLVRTIEGSGPVVIEFSPRPDFGRIPTVLSLTGRGVAVVSGAVALALDAPGVTWELIDDGVHQRAQALVELTPQLPITLTLVAGDGLDHSPAPFDVETRRSAVAAGWRTWAEGIQLSDPVLRRSALTLRALSYAPSGAILAAATTSLPEVIGGVRNWDYRFCWPRDAAHMARELVAVGRFEEAESLLGWIGERIRHLGTESPGDAWPSAERLRPLYPLVGDEFLPEAVIPTLNGYRGSRPVRVGNLAEHQLQLDMFGPIMELIADLTAAGRLLEPQTVGLVGSLAEAVMNRWRESDHGIWEDRRPGRHFVHSKLMCWVALDRAVTVAERLYAASIPAPDTTAWARTRAEVGEDLAERGWNQTVGAFTAAYGESSLDAAVLQLASSGLLAPDDPRLAATVTAIEAELRDGAVVYRYRHDDGLPGREGGFLMCTAWLIEALAVIGRRDDAEALFDRYRDLAGPTGLFAEQFDPATESALGNFPQGYSHAGLLRAARVLGLA